jgi:hypothetical protein
VVAVTSFLKRTPPAAGRSIVVAMPASLTEDQSEGVAAFLGRHKPRTVGTKGMDSWSLNIKFA